VRIGIDVGGTNTDAVLMDGHAVAAWTKQPTSADVAFGMAAAIKAILVQSGVVPATISSVMIGTTQFTNALVERNRLNEVGVIRLASPSGDALPPMTGWPADLKRCVGDHTFLLPGGYEVDGREIAPIDEGRIREAARLLYLQGVPAVAISSAFAPVNAAMELRAAELVREEHPRARITLSSAFGRIGLIERENATILNAALAELAIVVTDAFAQALTDAGIVAPTYVTQNDGTLISLIEAAAYPALTMGSGPTNSMRGAAFLTELSDAIVLDVGGTTTDIGVLVNGFPRESSVAVDIGGVRTGFRMPDVLAIGLGGGTRVTIGQGEHGDGYQVGPKSVGFRLTEEALVFGGDVLTASDVAVAMGRASFGDPALLPPLDDREAIWATFGAMIEDGLDRMKTARGDVDLLVVGGGNFLVDDAVKGALRVVRPPHAGVANAIGAAAAQVGANVERIVDYDRDDRETLLTAFAEEARRKIAAAGGDAQTVEIVEIDEVFLKYLPGRSVQLRVRAVGDLVSASAVHKSLGVEALA
jgi:N-methylhydantoinase A/oxoprolinase/acetone carboxylase beta subunit